MTTEYITQDNWDQLFNIKFTFLSGNKYNIKYCQNAICFDIETSSGFLDKEKNIVRPYIAKKYDKLVSYREAVEKYEPVSLMYIWMIAIEDIANDKIYKFIGRTWEAYTKFMTVLTLEIRRQAVCGFASRDRVKEYKTAQKSKTSVQAKCYVHNLSFEMQFLYNVFKHIFKGVFARNTHKPMKFYINMNKLHLEFRCTYFLTQKSLKNWCKDDKLPVQKADPINYEMIRTPLTKLSPATINYALADVVSMVYGIRKYRDKYGSLELIPLTQTGEVRADLYMNVCAKDPYWCQQMTEITQGYKFDFYLKLRKLFQGGWTHANACKVGKVYDNIVCFDFSSSYPATMTQELYPVEPFETCNASEFTSLESQDLYHPTYRWFAKIKLKNVKSKLHNSYWSYSKVEDCITPVLDNGRIAMMKEGTLYVTDFDWDTFKQAYRYDPDIEVLELYKSKAGYLSEALILRILDYYAGKTQLKGDEEQYSKYMSLKQMNNGIYGCFVMMLLMDEIEFNPDSKDGWDVKHYEDLGPAHFYETLSKIKAKHQFGCYQLGCWVTSIARHRLWHFIIHFDKDNKIIYCDTDSIKGLFDQNDIDYINNYNENFIRSRCKEVADHYGFDENLFRPKTLKKKEKPLGYMDREEDCSLITLGAKRYAALHGDKIETTIAGLPKKSGPKMIKKLTDFTNNTVWGAYYSKKSVAYYLNDQPECTWIDCQGQRYVSKDKYGIALKPTTFDLSMTDEFVTFVTTLQGKKINTQLNGHFNNDPYAF